MGIGRDGLSTDPLGVTLDIIRVAIEKLEAAEAAGIRARNRANGVEEEEELDLDNPEDDQL